MKKRLISLVGFLLLTSAAFAEISHDYLKYADETIRLDIYNPQNAACPIVILIHGAAGIEGDRAERYHKFATDLMDNGFIAINVHYFDAKNNDWQQVFPQAINYAENIPNGDKNRIGMVGYSLGGTIGLQVAAKDARVKALAVNAAYLPGGFVREHAANLPKILMISGTEDAALETLNTIKLWREDMAKPIETKLNQGLGHDNVPMDVFNDNWHAIITFLKQNL